MNNKNFYIFKGDWNTRQTEIGQLVDISDRQLVAIWTPKDKSKHYSLMVVSGAEIPPSHCLDQRIWKTDQEVFESFYQQKLKNYHVQISYRFQHQIKQREQLPNERHSDLIRA